VTAPYGTVYNTARSTHLPNHILQTQFDRHFVAKTLY